MTASPPVAATATATETDAPQPSATEAPTASPTPTLDRSTQNNSALYVASGAGGGSRVDINFLRPPRRSSRQTLIAFATDEASTRSAPVVPVTGDVDGDGSVDLVVGQAASGIGPVSDHVAVYRIAHGAPPVLLDDVSAFDGSALSGSGNLAVADVDASETGDEILVGEDGALRRASTIRVFGGLHDGGRLRLLRSLRVVALRIAVSRPLEFVTGELSSAHAGQEIVVAQPNGYVSIHGLTADGSARLQRFNPFADQDEVLDPCLAVGDVLPRVPGNELIAAVPGKRATGLIRVFDAMSGLALAELNAFNAGTVHTKLTLWVGDVIAALPGAELLVGKGDDGGDVAVFSLASATPRKLFNLPGGPRRTSALTRFLTIGDLIPNMPGLELAVAQPDPQVPVDIYHLTTTGTENVVSVAASDFGTIGAISGPPGP